MLHAIVFSTLNFVCQILHITNRTARKYLFDYYLTGDSTKLILGTPRSQKFWALRPTPRFRNAVPIETCADLVHVFPMFLAHLVKWHDLQISGSPALTSSPSKLQNARQKQSYMNGFWLFCCRRNAPKKHPKSLQILNISGAYFFSSLK